MSLRLKLLNFFFKIALKPRLRHLEDPIRARKDLERSAKWVFRPVPLTAILPIKIQTVSGKIIPALSIRNRPSLVKLDSNAPRRIILYLHGGGYVAGSPRTHQNMLARLSRLTKLEIIAPWYGLAPEHPFPAAFIDVCAAFNALTAKGYSAENILIGGDSAGGGLALALMAKLCAEGTPPCGVFAFSPLTDMRFWGASFSENADKDPLFPTEKKALIAKLYLNGHSPDDPRASPLLADFSTPPPPVFLQFAKTELLRDDSLRMAENLRQSGGNVHVDQWENTPHVWVLFDGILPEARESLERTANFINSINSMH